MKDLPLIVDAFGNDAEIARRLCCFTEFIQSWRPRPLPNGRTEPGLEPSAGFIASALAILRKT
jgi:hypothetical protein